MRTGIAHTHMLTVFSCSCMEVRILSLTFPRWPLHKRLVSAAEHTNVFTLTRAPCRMLSHNCGGNLLSMSMSNSSASATLLLSFLPKAHHCTHGFSALTDLGRAFKHYFAGPFLSRVWNVLAVCFATIALNYNGVAFVVRLVLIMNSFVFVLELGAHSFSCWTASGPLADVEAVAATALFCAFGRLGALCFDHVLSKEEPLFSSSSCVHPRIQEREVIMCTYLLCRWPWRSAASGRSMQ